MISAMTLISIWESSYGVYSSQLMRFARLLGVLDLLNDVVMTIMLEITF